MAKRFTEAEKEIILKHIRANKTNLLKGFADAAAEIGRSSAESISALYYNHLRKDHRIFSLAAGTKNVKNAIRSNNIVEQRQLTRQLNQAIQNNGSDAEIARIMRRKAQLRGMLR